MTEGLRMKELNITSLFVERIAHTVIPDPDQAEGDIKDTIYQNVGIAFFVREIPNKVGNDIMDKFYLLL